MRPRCSFLLRDCVTMISGPLSNTTMAVWHRFLPLVGFHRIPPVRPLLLRLVADNERRCIDGELCALHARRH